MLISFYAKNKDSWEAYKRGCFQFENEKLAVCISGNSLAVEAMDDNHSIRIILSPVEAQRFEMQLDLARDMLAENKASR